MSERLNHPKLREEASRSKLNSEDSRPVTQDCEKPPPDAADQRATVFVLLFAMAGVNEPECSRNNKLVTQEHDSEQETQPSRQDKT